MIDRTILDKVSVLNDRVLIFPAQPKLKSGLILPDGVAVQEVIKSGYIIKKGKGYPMVNKSDDEKPWENKVAIQMTHVPLSVDIGNFVYYMDRQSIMIRHEGYDLVVAPEGAIMMVVNMTESLEEVLSGVDR